MSKYIFAILSFFLLFGFIVFPRPVSAALGVGVGSYYLGGSNKTQGFNGCLVPYYRSSGSLALTYFMGNGSPLATMGFSNNEHLGTDHYNLGINNCTGGTTSVMGIWRNTTQTALDAYGGNQNGYWTSYIPGLVKNYYNQTSSIFITNVGGQTIYSIVIYDNNGVVVQQTAGQLNARAIIEYDLKDVLNLPNGRYSAVIVAEVHSLITTTVITRNESGPDRVIAWRGLPYGDTKLFMPSLRKNYYGYYSTLILTNTTESNANITVTIVGGPTVFINNLPPHGTYAKNSGDLNMPDGDYTVVIESDQNLVGMSSTYHSTNNARGAYSLPQSNLDSSRYRSLPALWNVTPASSPRITSVKCMDTAGMMSSFRLTIQNGVFADSPWFNTGYAGYEFTLQNISQFPQHTMFAGLAENLYYYNIACIASSTVSGATEDKFFQYESNFSNNDTNQANSSKSLTLYDDQ